MLVFFFTLNLLPNFMKLLNQQIEELGAVVHHHSPLYLTFVIFYHTCRGPRLGTL